MEYILVNSHPVHQTATSHLSFYFLIIQAKPRQCKLPLVVNSGHTAVYHNCVLSSEDELSFKCKPIEPICP